MKVLVIRFSSIGDIVLTTPVVRCLKQQRGAQVHYLTKSAFGTLLINNPYIDKIHYLQDDMKELVAELEKEKFDYIIDLHNNIRTMRVKKGLKKVMSYSFPKLNVKKWLLVNFKVDVMPDKSIVERYMETVRPLGIHNDTTGLDYFLPEDKKIKNTDIPMSHWGGYVGCVIGGSYNTKKLPIEKWKEFAAAMPYPIILLGGPDDRDEGNSIAELDPVRIYNSCGKFNLNESAELVKHAQVIVSNDTGLMHVATAFQKPVISLWGNTSPEMGMFPYYGSNNLKERVSPLSVIIENKGLSCHPCSKLGYDRCPKGHFKCMKELDMKLAAAETVAMWKPTTKL